MTDAPRRSTDSTIAVNKRAFHEYEVLEKFEAGLKLVGTEVKALRQGSVHFPGTYVVPRTLKTGPILQLINLHIGPFKPAGPGQHDPLRPRQLLLHAREVAHLIGALQEKGRTAIPLDIHARHGLMKVTIALARGKQLYDKRRTLKERDEKRTVQRALRQH